MNDPRADEVLAIIARLRNDLGLTYVGPANITPRSDLERRFISRALGRLADRGLLEPWSENGTYRIVAENFEGAAAAAEAD